MASKMRIKSAGLPEQAAKFLSEQGYESLYPPQAQAVRAGLLSGKSLLVSAPTASGKTLIAMMAMMGHLHARRPGKIAYLSPLKALASEKYAEFSKLEGLELGGRRPKVAMSVGSMEGSKKDPAKSDILVLTNERMDYMARNGAEWAANVGLIIADEVHLVGDESRGPVLEMILTRARRLGSCPQILGLSATVTNAGEIASWLGAKLVSSDWRPVGLSEGVFDGYSAQMDNGRTIEAQDSGRGPAADLGIQSVKEGGQSLLFASTRPNSVSLAAKASGAVFSLLGSEDKKGLLRVSKKILDSGERTDLVKTLADLVKQGVAFHHAGLSQPCRQAVEDGFKSGAIRLISTTPTLAAGVNLPARRVVISSIMRYNAREGRSMPIRVLDYKQMCGRAGRPQYDKYGEAVIVAPNQDPDQVFEHYVHGEPEPIESAIIEEASLRTHALGLVSLEAGIRQDDVVGFFMGTFGGSQYGKAQVKSAVAESCAFLSEREMIAEKGGRLAATRFGKKVSSLYLDPQTAWEMREAIGQASPGRKRWLGWLHIISQCTEFYPKMQQRIKDAEAALDLVERRRDEMLVPIEPEECSRSLLALDMWVSERTERQIADALKAESGDVHRMAETAGWLAHCMGEIARHLGNASAASEIAALQGRIRYGVKPELLGLVSVRGIGRVRARALYRGGTRTKEALAAMPADRLASVDKIGPKMAKRIKQQLSRKGDD